MKTHKSSTKSHAQYAVKVSMTVQRTRLQSSRSSWTNRADAQALFDHLEEQLVPGEFAALLKYRPDTGKVTEVCHYLP